MYDLIIRNGTIADGSGRPTWVGDVAIEGNRIVADVMQCEEAPLFPHPDGSPTDFKKSRARLCRWTFDLAGDTDRFKQTYLDDIIGEFPRIDDRRAGLASGHG